MGTWGMGAFENDTAADWVWELEDSEGADVVRAALAAAADTGERDYLETTEGVIAIAAAEVVAAAAGSPAPGLPEEVQTWVDRHGRAVADLVGLAQRAVRRTMGAESELRELWSPEEDADPADVAEWERRVADLERRLASAAAP